MVLFLWCPCAFHLPFPPFFAPHCPCSGKPQVKGLPKRAGPSPNLPLHGGISGGVDFRRGRNLGMWASPPSPCNHPRQQATHQQGKPRWLKSSLWPRFQSQPRGVIGGLGRKDYARRGGLMQKRDPLDSAVLVMSMDGHRRSTPLGGSVAQLRLPRAQFVSSWPTFYPALQWCQGLARYLSPRNRSSAQ